MKLYDYFQLFYFNIKASKLKNILYSIIISLILVVGNILINTNDIFLDYIKDITEDTIESKTIYVHNDNLEYGDEIKEILSLPSVSYAFNQTYNSKYVTSDIFDNDFIILKPIYSEFSPNIVIGRNIESDNEIICPLYLGSVSSTKTEELVDMKNYLNKEITLSYSNNYYYGTSINEVEVANKFSEKVKIVGLFSNYKTLSTDGFKECYMVNSKIIEMNEQSKDIYSDEFLKQNNINDSGFYTNVIVKNNDSILQVTQKLTSIGYDVNASSFELDQEFINNMMLYSQIGLIMIGILLCFILIVYISSFIKSKKYEIGLYKSFGYTNKIISNIISFQTLILTLISYIISLIISFILCKAINYIANSYLQFYYFTMNYSILKEVIYFILLLCIIYIISLIISNKILKIEAKDILNENN